MFIALAPVTLFESPSGANSIKEIKKTELNLNYLTVEHHFDLTMDIFYGFNYSTSTT